MDVEITALSAHAGLLWIGTSAGLALSVSLPRLGGVPLLATATKVGIVYYDLVERLLLIIKYEMAKIPDWPSGVCMSRLASDRGRNILV